MNINERLLLKIKKNFPNEIKEDNCLPLRRVYGVNDGTHYAWSNGGVGTDHIFSYHTMKECMDNEIFICMHYPFEGNHGYEIYIK